MTEKSNCRANDKERFTHRKLDALALSRRNFSRPKYIFFGKRELDIKNYNRKRTREKFQQKSQIFLEVD